MADELHQLENWVAPLLAKLAPNERRRLAFTLARAMRQRQKRTMAGQRAPDGSPWEPRKKQRKAAPPIRYVYRKRDGEVRELEMSSYRRQGGRIIGYDKEAGGIRTMIGESVIRKVALRHGTGAIKARVKRANLMMTGLARSLTARATPSEASVGFVGRAARIAALHHGGGPDRVTPGGPTYDYPARPLIGFTDELASELRSLLIDHLTT